MLATPHLLSGAAIVTIVPNPVVSLPLAFASHFILDKIPHWQETLAPYELNNKTWVRMPIDLLLGLGLLWWVTKTVGGNGIMWLGALVALVPDADSVFYARPLREVLQQPLARSWFSFHERIQRETDKWWGLLPQIAVVLLSLFFILNYA
ncbi:MAG: hypothetical protein Q7S60_04645 [bacterium]|nr:hypothetical protein [bacterium]